MLLDLVAVGPSATAGAGVEVGLGAAPGGVKMPARSAESSAVRPSAGAMTPQSGSSAEPICTRSPNAWRSVGGGTNAPAPITDGIGAKDGDCGGSGRGGSELGGGGSDGGGSDAGFGSTGCMGGCDGGRCEPSGAFASTSVRSSIGAAVNSGSGLGVGTIGAGGFEWRRAEGGIGRDGAGGSGGSGGGGGGGREGRGRDGRAGRGDPSGDDATSVRSSEFIAAMRAWI